ncbi:helix-turn-helix domain-containing protein [Maioricimonas rarisocia]|nr:hypothetical protein [Maioricimonas rarisocia]
MDAILSELMTCEGELDALRVLEAYAEAEAAAAEAAQPTPEGTEEDPNRGWNVRVQHVPGVADGRLAPLHGRLIALGYLKYRLTSRTDGILYRLTPEGRDLLEQSAELLAQPIEEVAAPVEIADADDQHAISPAASVEETEPGQANAA